MLNIKKFIQAVRRWKVDWKWVVVAGCGITVLEIFGTPFVIPLWLKKVISTLGMALVVSGGFMACMQFAVNYFGREEYAVIPASIIDHEFRWFFGLFALLTFCLMMIFQPWLCRILLSPHFRTPQVNQKSQRAIFNRRQQSIIILPQLR